MFTRRERGTEAAWLREQRKVRWSNVHVAVDDFERLTGHRIHYSRWAAYESGAKPIRDDHMDAFVAFFGSGPASEVKEPTGDFAALVAEQSELITKQNELLANQVAVLERIAAVLERLAPPGSAGGLPQGGASDQVEREYVDESARRQGEPSKRRDHATTRSGGSGSPRTLVGTGSSRSEPLR
jgi:hypothetical protein